MALKGRRKMVPGAESGHEGVREGDKTASEAKAETKKPKKSLRLQEPFYLF